MPRRRLPALVGVLARWMLGTVLVSWRYLWETTPLHRLEREADADERAPELPEEWIDSGVQLAQDGCGAMFHRRFRVRVAGARLDAEQLMALVAGDFKHFVPSEVVDVRTVTSGSAAAGAISSDGLPQPGLVAGDEMVVEMPGPWNGPVRVVHREPTRLRLVTLQGHLEAGQVQFQAFAEDELLVFEIELWARAASRLVDLLYSRLRLAKEVQLNMWVRFCLAAAATAGGRPADGVHIRTHRMTAYGRDAGCDDGQPSVSGRDTDRGGYVHTHGLQEEDLR
jgi:hypothetical protein